MANDIGGTAGEAKETETAETGDDNDICTTALARYDRWYERERENTDQAYEDLRFRAGEQWPAEVIKAREEESRPIANVNVIPQFVRQITGDMRQMKPSIRVVPVDSMGDKDTAETIAGMIRYVENRSDAGSAYMSGADSQVIAGIGHWRVATEYAAENTFNQEIRIMGVDDGVAVAWDPDAVLPTREDAKWCIVPVDMSKEAFEEQYPEASVEDFSSSHVGATANGWFDKDFVRVAEYWVKEPIKRLLALFPDGSIIDLTDKDETERLTVGNGAKKVEERDGFKICRYLITAAHVLDKADWPGMYIPIVPVLGEEVRIGRKTVRHGIVRFAKDPQRMVNYYSAAETEVIALQPKSPFVGTEKNFEKYQSEWAEANRRARPYLPFTPDPLNNGAPPQRVAPPVGSSGIAEGLARATQQIKEVIGIYDAGLGKQGNETSGKAILARQREGDVGSFVYIDNWTRAIRHTGKIVVDLIPHVYDSERMIRIMGEDGKVDLKWINRTMGMQQDDPATGQPGKPKIENDLTVGAYDVVIENGPSFSTKREEAKDSMNEFMKISPNTAPVILDLYAKAMDWPLGDEIAKRFEAVAPPQIQQLLHRQKQDSGQQEPPDQMQQQQMMQAQQHQQMQQAAVQLDLQNKQLQNQKLQVEIATATQSMQAGQGDPLVHVKAAEAQQTIQHAQDRHAVEMQGMVADQQAKAEIHAIQKQLMIADLGTKQHSIVQDAREHIIRTAQSGDSHATDMAHSRADLVMKVDKHHATIENMASKADNAARANGKPRAEL